MHSNTIKALITVSVLSFGLISCSKDKENTVIYKQDEFKPDRISTENEDKSIFDGEISTLEAGGKLKFDSLAKHDFNTNPVVFHVESSCRQNKNPNLMVASTDFQNQKQVDVASLLPADLFASLSEDKANCDFTITTHNGLGSTNINKLYNIEITNLLKFVNFETDLANEGRVELDVAREEPINIGGKGAVKLVCQDFTRQLNYVDEKFTLKDLDIENPGVLAGLTSSAQNCRIVFDGSGAPKVTKAFSLVFTVQPLVVRGVVAPLAIVNNLQNQKMIDFQVINPNAFPVRFQIYRASTMRAVVRPLYMSGASPFIGRMQRTVVALKADAGDSTMINNDLFFTVGGGQMVTVSGIATRKLICQNNAPTVPRTPYFKGHPGQKTYNLTLFAGYNYDFEINPKFMYQTNTQTWEELDVAMVGKTHDSNVSDYGYWVWPSNQQIMDAFGIIVPIWENLNEWNDVCTD
jgi:hypothetical protein